MVIGPSVVTTIQRGDGAQEGRADGIGGDLRAHTEPRRQQYDAGGCEQEKRHSRTSVTTTS